MAAREVHERGALVRFTHWDARREPKRKRPGVVADCKTGNQVLYYGSTFKKGGYPKDAIEVSPSAELGSLARELADELPGFVDEPTFFHGSLLAEGPLRGGDVVHVPRLGFPNDLLDDLEEQAEDRLVGFFRAWAALRWLPPRARMLQALWWGPKQLDLETSALLSLALCDGWTLHELEALRWSHLARQEDRVRVNDESRFLLPHTAGLLRQLQLDAKSDEVWTAASREAIVKRLQEGWNGLAAQLPKAEARRLPRWDQVLTRIDR